MQGRLFPKLILGTLCAVILTLAAGAGPAHAWWDAKWKFRKKITLDTTPQGADVKEALTDFPVLVRLHTGNFTFGNAKPDGSDIRLIAPDDKTPLKYHIEQYDPKTEMVLIWVKVPQIVPSSAEGFIWLYYGNGSASSGEDSGGTFDTPQFLVYHLTEKDGPPQDATAYKNNAKEFTGKLGTPSPIGRGITLKGETDRLVIGKSPSLAFSKGFTFSAWVRSSVPQKEARLFSWDDGKQSLVVGLDGTKLSAWSSDGKKKTSTGTVDLPSGKWVHVAVTAEPGKDLILYTDGRQKGQAKLSSVPEPSSYLSLGASLSGKNGFAGDLDEIGLAGIARSASWVQAASAAQGPDSPLLVYQDEEGSSGGGESLTVHLLVVTAKAITLDGWLIIGLIIVMIAITWILFFNKFVILRKLKKDNAAFSEAFTSSEAVLTLKGEEERFPDSSLQRVYGAGVNEIDRRLASVNGGKPTVLPARAFTAFRGVLDKAALEESKRNTAGLLLFTLSISGGPFMGLFGTVWGVINTFAGVAEAGEANLAAIAPGVASALACTLMGLTLAIPALFQYSYLSAEIKNITADMNVFMDELTNRVEEEYGGKA
jgi:biopolymer transport protein ExbB